MRFLDGDGLRLVMMAETNDQAQYLRPHVGDTNVNFFVVTKLGRGSHKATQADNIESKVTGGNILPSLLLNLTKRRSHSSIVSAQCDARWCGGVGH